MTVKRERVIVKEKLAIWVGPFIHYQDKEPLPTGLISRVPLKFKAAIFLNNNVKVAHNWFFPRIYSNLKSL